MLDLDDLVQALGEAAGLRRIGASARTQGCIRVGFGTLLFGLSAVGVVMTLGYDASLHFRLAGAALFASIGAFGLLNIVFLRPWRWPGCAVLLALVGLFAVRIVLGP